MRLARARMVTGNPTELSIAAMIDVVFLLLIFFLVTTTMAAPERQLDPAIAVDRDARGQSVLQLQPLVIDIYREQGVAVYRAGATWGESLSTIMPIIDNYPDPSAGAIINLSDGVPFNMAAQAINAVREADFEAVSLVPVE